MLARGLRLATAALIAAALLGLGWLVARGWPVVFALLAVAGGVPGAEGEGRHAEVGPGEVLGRAQDRHARRGVPRAFVAVGVAFGAVAEGLPGADLSAAIALAIGIGIQDFPEGLAVALPLRRYGLSRRKSFMWGQLSGAVEPLAAMLGVGLVMIATPILPYALAFAAGAMIYVVVEEVIPESQRDGHTDKATLGLMFGFVLMMALDVGLG